MKRGLIVLIFCLILVAGCAQQTVDYIAPHITNANCDVETSCPEEFSCYDLGEGPICVDPNPCDWYCDEGEECLVLESYPPQLSCFVSEPEEIEVEEETSTIGCDESIQLYIEQNIIYEDTSVTLQSVANDAIVLNIGGEYESLDLYAQEDFGNIIVRVDAVYPRADDTEDSSLITILCELDNTYFTDSFGNAVACDETASIKVGDTLFYNEIPIYLESLNSSQASLEIDDYPRALSTGDIGTTDYLELTVEGIYTRADPTESSVSFKISC